MRTKKSKREGPKNSRAVANQLTKNGHQSVPASLLQLKKFYKEKIWVSAQEPFRKNEKYEQGDKKELNLRDGGLSKNKPDSVVQRIVVTGANKDRQDFDAATPAAISQAGGPVKEWGDAEFTGEGKIAVVAHGGINSITLGGKAYDGTSLANALIAKNLEANSIVYLWSCKAGMQNVENGSSIDGSSLVETTVEGLSPKVENVIVKGFRGTTIFNEGDGNKSRIVDPKLSKGNPDKEGEYIKKLIKLDMHHVYKAGYFSHEYITKHMKGWKLKQVELPSGKQNLWTIDKKVYRTHTGENTMEDFYRLEKEAHVSKEEPDWLASKDAFESEKKRLLMIAGRNSANDSDYAKITLRESDETHDQMVRTEDSNRLIGLAALGYGRELRDS